MAADVHISLESTPIEFHTAVAEPSRKNARSGDERRGGLRFNLTLDLTFRVLYRGKPLFSGSGRSIDLGSSGIAFTTDAPLRPGSALEIAVSWPALLHGECPMRLVITGTVIRATGDSAVCSVQRHEFRTRARVPPTMPAVQPVYAN